MTWRTVRVPRSDIGLLRVAIAAGGGTITGYQPSNEDVEVTYVVPSA